MRISKSKLLSFITCPEKYYLSYELGLRPLKTPSELVIGQSTHHLIACHFQSRMAGETCDLNEILNDFWADRSPENTDFKTAGDLEASKRLSLDLARLFLTETSLEPLQVEYRFSLPVINVMTGEVLQDLELVGVIDLIDLPNGNSRAVEIKTKAKKPDDFGARTSIELTCYAYWLRFLEDVESIPVSYVNIIKIKKPYVHWQDQERGAQDFVDLYHTIKTVAVNISDGRFYKNPGVHCNWCDYKPVCIKDMKTVDEIFGHEAVESLTHGSLTGDFLKAACG